MRRVLVTGASRGIGLEFVRQLLAAGDRVIAGCRHPGQATALNALSAKYPNRLHVLPLDVTDARSRDELVRELALVSDGLDLLLNNAGVLPSGERFGTIEETAMTQAFACNCAGPFLLAQALVPILRNGVSPRIANLSSTLGSITRVDGFHTPSYAISKAAQNMATALLAQALKDYGITVVALHPGWVRTDMGGSGAPLDAAESVRGMLSVIDTLDSAGTGSFLDWRGQPVPW